MDNQVDFTPRHRWLQILIGVAVFANFAPLFVTIIGGDGTLYAAISKTMALNNDYVNLIGEGKDWLDKPHFPFWVTALSFEVFGIHGWSYKLPGILFLMMGAWYTYLFAKKLYSRQTGLLAALILLTAEHILLFSNDVRAEPYLTGLIIAAVYYFICLQEEYSFKALILGSLFTACAVMTKGIFALLPIGGAIIGHLILTGQWKLLIQLRWVGAILLVFVFITPELYCLWLQFDTHPEKVVFGQTNVSGLRFFFWDSQFGRFFNSGPIKGKGDLTFFIHTTLWAFLPWSVMLFIAIGKRFSKFRKPGLEWYSFFAAIPTFLLFSLSSFQLPHYMNIVFPFFAVLTAEYLLSVKLSTSLQKIFTLQLVIVILLFVAGSAIQILYQPAWWGWVLLAAGAALTFVFTPKNTQFVTKKIVIISSAAIVSLNLYLFWVLYPDLLKYQAGSEVAFIANEKYPGIPVVQYRYKYSYPLEFYLKAPLITIDTPATGFSHDISHASHEAISVLDTIQGPFLLLTPEVSDTTKVGDAMILPSFRIAKLNIKFINKKRRLSQVQWSKLELIKKD
ncbi:MAG: glycosyl transferase [Chitinophagaceae bacterium]|nr:MAG: glycosyl transferase [Chitinophagaceae bacterium]